MTKKVALLTLGALVTSVVQIYANEWTQQRQISRQKIVNELASLKTEKKEVAEEISVHKKQMEKAKKNFYLYFLKESKKQEIAPMQLMLHTLYNKETLNDWVSKTETYNENNCDLVEVLELLNTKKSNLKQSINRKEEMLDSSKRIRTRKRSSPKRFRS